MYTEILSHASNLLVLLFLRSKVYDGYGEQPRNV